MLLHALSQPWWFSLLIDFAHLSVIGALVLSAVVIAWDASALALWAVVLRSIRVRSRLPALVVAPIAMGLIEAAWPSFFEWHLGVVQWRAWPLVQIAELGGAAAVSGLLVLINLVLAELAVDAHARRVPSRSTCIGCIVIVVVVACSVGRAKWIESAQSRAASIEVGIAQPNFGPLTIEERSREGRRLVAALREATRSLASDGAELVVWPESAWPYFWDRRRGEDFPERHPWSLRRRETSAVLVGALTHPFGSSDLYNSAFLLRASGEIAGIYDKGTLVPFSEYVPLGARYPSWKAAVERQMPDRPEITPGRQAVVLEEGSARLGVLICSEDLDALPALVASATGANLLVSIVNDSWFRGSGAVQQHLALATLRAVETRRHLIRVTTNGVSAHVDAVGRVRLEGPLVEVAPKERKPPTLLRTQVPLLEISSIGNATIRWFPWSCGAVLAIALAVGSGRRG